MPNWNSLANNQLVDRTALNDAVANSIFTLKSGQTVPTGTQCVTALEAKTWLNLNETVLPTGNQLPIRQQLMPASASSYSFACKMKHSAPSASACIYIGISSFTDIVYTASPTLDIDTIVYANESLTIPLGVTSFILPNSSTYYFVSSSDGKITAIGSC